MGVTHPVTMRSRLPRVTPVPLVLGAGGAVIAGSWAIAAEKPAVPFAAFAVGGLAALGAARRGACIALLVLAAMNGIPFLDTSRSITGNITIGDVGAVALCIAAGLWILIDQHAYRPPRIALWISRCGMVLLIWWLVTLLRSTGAPDHVPLLRAAHFGRDFAYFALLLVLLPRVRLEREDIVAATAVLLAGACAFAVGQVLTALGLAGTGGLIHYEYTVQENGLTRVYAPMTDLVDAATALCIAAVLVSRHPRVRLVALGAGALLIASVLVQLTRARWIGLIAGVVLVTAWFMLDGQTTAARLVRRRAPVSAAVLVLVALLVGPAVIPGLHGITARALQGIASIETGGGSVGVRVAAAHVETGYLGSAWPIGLGFLSPSTHYFAGLPLGNIRDSDLGVLNAVATMGVIGAVLIYLPIALALFHSLRRSSSRVHGPFAWLVIGGAIWLVASIVGSATLVTFFSVSGLILTGVVVTVLTNPVMSEVLPSDETINARRLTLPRSVV